MLELASMTEDWLYSTACRNAAGTGIVIMGNHCTQMCSVFPIAVAEGLNL